MQHLYSAIRNKDPSMRFTTYNNNDKHFENQMGEKFKCQIKKQSCDARKNK